MWGKGVKITSIDGFDIKVDASWLLIATLIVWSLATGYFPSKLPLADPSTLVGLAVIAMLGLFGSLILHELAHAVVARRFGLNIHGITLFLFGGVAELQTEPTDGRSEFWIAIAGPIASLCIALGFWGGAQFLTVVGFPEAAQLVFQYLATVNLVLAIFNLLPAFPMDGGRVYRAWLWTRSGNLLAATRYATTVSAVFAYMFMMLGFYAAFSGDLAVGLWPILIGLFLLATSRAALARLETEIALGARTVEDLMTRAPWTARPYQTLSEVVDSVFLDHGIIFAPVIENNTLLGYVDLQLVQRIDRENWANTTVEDVIESTREENTVLPEMQGRDLMERILKTGRRKFLVAGEYGLVGVITLSDLLAYLRVSQEIG
ncbi:site-2 protease family protein [Falsihalocynthiibacter sp. BN13B15]|uniref:site-2 protease family protein n=1 Tax=Falsihalocynthiibacter sp. BN13B15 TaxID=3240871 RepID=UPI00350FB025